MFWGGRGIWGGEEGLGFFPPVQLFTRSLYVPMDLLQFSFLQRHHLSLWRSCKETTWQPCAGLMLGTELWGKKKKKKKGQKSPCKLWLILSRAQRQDRLCHCRHRELVFQPVPRELPARDAPWLLELLFRYLPISTIKQLFLLSNPDLSLQFKPITGCLILWGSSEKKISFFSFGLLKAPINCTLPWPSPLCREQSS